MAPLLAKPVDDHFEWFMKLDWLPEAPRNCVHQQDNFAGGEFPKMHPLGPAVSHPALPQGTHTEGGVG